MAEKITVQAKVDTEWVERLDALAEKLGWTRSELIAHCIGYGVKDGEKFAKRLQTPVLGHFMRLVLAMDAEDEEEVRQFEAMWKTVRKREIIQGKEAST